jgi:hypothetical protein
MHGRLVVIKLKFFHMVDVSFSFIFLLTVHFVSHDHAVTRTGGTRKADPHDQKYQWVGDVHKNKSGGNK